MANEALGMIEVRGYVGALEAADAMVKAARVEIVGTFEAGSGYVAVYIQGDVGAVKAAVEAGRIAAEKLGKIIAVSIIPRPHVELGVVLRQLHGGTGGNGGHPTTEKLRVKKLADMTVAELRALARDSKELDLKGRDISVATKEDLLLELKKIRQE
jgi:ethanolamine utilization protein EutM